MSLKKLPWTSLLLLLLAYYSFGWFLYPPNMSWFNWIYAVAFALLVSGTLTAPQKSIRYRFLRWSVSSSGSFIIVVILAFFTAVFLFLIHVFVHILVALSAATLTRLDLQAAEFSQDQAFWVISLVSLIGLGLGWGINHFI